MVDLSIAKCQFTRGYHIHPISWPVRIFFGVENVAVGIDVRCQTISDTLKHRTVCHLRCAKMALDEQEFMDVNGSYNKHWDIRIYNISTRFSWFSGSFRLVVRPFHVASKRIKGVFSLMGCFICYFSSSEMNSPDMCMFYYVLLFSVIPWLSDFSFR